MRNVPQIFTNLQRQRQPIDPGVLLDIQDDQMIESVLAENGATKQITVGRHSMNVEIADTTASRRKGLMHRREIGSDGMLFMMDEEPASFHMTNTFIPLDIVYFDDAGQAVKIDVMKPKTGRSSCDTPISYALELPAGTCDKVGIKVGDMLITETDRRIRNEMLLRRIIGELLK